MDELKTIRWRQRFQNLDKAFQNQIISEGEIWLDMLGKRNLLAHTYDEVIALEAYNLIKLHFAPQIEELVQWFHGCDKRTED